MNQVAVLVVEDMPQTRATAVQIFEEIGCKVFDAYNGQQALTILKAHPEIKVLFTDMRLPGMNGDELAHEARRLRPDLHVVLTSGYVGQDAVPNDLPFVPKPWHAHDLIAVVRYGANRKDGRASYAA